MYNTLHHATRNLLQWRVPHSPYHTTPHFFLLDTSHHAKPNRPNRTKPNRAKPNQTKPNQTKSNQTKINPKPNQIEPNRTKPKQTEANQTKPNQAKPSQAKPSQTKPIRTELNRTKPNQAKPIRTELEQDQTKQRRGTQRNSINIYHPPSFTAATSRTARTNPLNTDHLYPPCQYLPLPVKSWK